MNIKFSKHNWRNKKQWKLAGLFALCFGVLGVANSHLQSTNWYMNHSLNLTSQFQNLSNTTHYDIVNVGSNPARFCIFYENVSGANWSTGTQSLEEDYQILKHYHKYLVDSAVVLLPVCAFSSVSGYLHSEEEHRNLSFWQIKKFSSILPDSAIQKMPGYNDIEYELKDHLPLLTSHFPIRVLYDDDDENNELENDHNDRDLCNMENDAHNWMYSIWANEFNIKDFAPPASYKAADSLTASKYLPKHLVKGRDWAIKKMQRNIDYVKSLGCIPVIVVPPVSAALGKHFNEYATQVYINSYLREFTKQGIPCFNYLHDSRFSKHELYTNALFMNFEGRKLFSRQLINDLVEEDLLHEDVILQDAI